MGHSCTLLIIMMLGGSAGGVASYLATDVPENETRPLLRRITLGVVAAFVVPLFLNMISSSIVEDAATSPINYLLFAGFCVVAGFSSKAFLSSLSDKLLDRLREVEARQEALSEDVEPIIERGTEPEPEAGLPLARQAIDIDEDEKKILKALANPKFVRRYVSGVATDTGFEDVKAVYHLLMLRDKGLVAKKKGRKLDLFWLTPRGWQEAQTLGLHGDV